MPLRVIFDQVIKLVLRADVGFDPARDGGRTALQYVAKGQRRTHAPQREIRGLVVELVQCSEEQYG